MSRHSVRFLFVRLFNFIALALFLPLLRENKGSLLSFNKVFGRQKVERGRGEFV